MNHIGNTVYLQGRAYMAKKLDPQEIEQSRRKKDSRR